MSAKYAVYRGMGPARASHFGWDASDCEIGCNLPKCLASPPQSRHQSNCLLFRARLAVFAIGGQVETEADLATSLAHGDLVPECLTGPFSGRLPFPLGHA